MAHKVAKEIRHELARSFDFRGRLARGPYLRFLLASVLCFVAVLWAVVQIVPAGWAGWAVFAVTALFYIPVTSAGVRRLHDIGETGLLMLDPLKPALAVAILAFCFATLLAEAPVFGGAIIALAMLTPLVALAYIAVVLAALVYTLMYFSHTMGLLLLPSDDGANAYGPNPNEVST